MSWLSRELERTKRRVILRAIRETQFGSGTIDPEVTKAIIERVAQLWAEEWPNMYQFGKTFNKAIKATVIAAGIAAGVAFLQGLQGNPELMVALGSNWWGGLIILGITAALDYLKHRND